MSQLGAAADSQPMLSTAPNPHRAPVRLVGAPADLVEEWGWFCGHCGARRLADAPAPIARVCGDCGLGLLLEARVDALPGPDDAFLVIDSSLTVQALSSRAEIALGVREGHAVNRHVTELVIPADAEEITPVSLAVAITRAARGEDEQSRVFVRPSNTFGVRLEARIATCGPPRAALLVLK